METLPRTDTFQKRFNLSKKSQRQSSLTRNKAKQKPLVGRVLWWTSLLFVSALPTYLAVLTDLQGAWSSIDNAVKTILDFPVTHRIRLPSANTGQEGGPKRAFEVTNNDLVAWHRDMSRLQQHISDANPVGAVQDSTLEFVFSSSSKSAAREWRAAAVSVYILMAASLYFGESVHVAVVLLQINVLEFSLAIKIKRLDDALEKTLEHLSTRQMELAMMPLESDAVSIGQQLVCLQKMQIFYNAWNQVNLGQNVRIPFRKDFVNLNLSLVFSIVAAVFLRTVEVLLVAVWPSLPRLNLSHRLYAWVRRKMPDHCFNQENAGETALCSAPSTLEGQPSLATSLDSLFKQNSIGGTDFKADGGEGPPTQESPASLTTFSNTLTREDSLSKRANL